MHGRYLQYFSRKSQLKFSSRILRLARILLETSITQSFFDISKNFFRQNIQKPSQKNNTSKMKNEIFRRQTGEYPLSADRRVIDPRRESGSPKQNKRDEKSEKEMETKGNPSRQRPLREGAPQRSFGKQKHSFLWFGPIIIQQRGPFSPILLRVCDRPCRVQPDDSKSLFPFDNAAPQ